MAQSLVSCIKTKFILSTWRVKSGKHTLDCSRKLTWLPCGGQTRQGSRGSRDGVHLLGREVGDLDRRGGRGVRKKVTDGRHLGRKMPGLEACLDEQ